MFSFHKPKIYRSNLGCCICKAKSSSSRFTDSKKYENEFERCFRIDEKRSGEICNACVLLVKRWKKLSPENRLTKHWHHVVDARAGPGTKLTGNRRIIGHHNNNHHHQQHSDSPNSQTTNRSNNNNNKSEQALPLSSSNQANHNQSTSSSSSVNSSSSPQSNSTRGRNNLLNKARAIDTNVSTFTFGEPPSAYRRGPYKTTPTSEPTTSSSYHQSSSPMLKPQSALNSNAFELVIKRFRQRQQQQHLEAQRRLLNRQERQRLRQLNHDKSNTKTTTVKTTTTTTTSPVAAKEEEEVKETSSEQTATSTTRRVASKRSCENSSSTSSGSGGGGSSGANGALEALQIGQLLDGSIWRKEKICCGIIFRGLHNEVAIFPKLLRPCECRAAQNSTTSGKESRVGGENDERLSSSLEEEEDDEEEEEEEEYDDDDNALLNDQKLPPNSPPPRATKSGSISSCNSSTSGTGSMEPTLDEIKRSNRDKNDPSPAVRPRSVPAKRRLQQLKRQKPGDVECSISIGSGASTTSSSKESGGAPNSPHSSEHSSPISTRMVLIDDCGEEIVDTDEDNVDHDDVDDELVMAQDDSCESSNDASSSGESLIEMERKKSGAVA